MRIHEIHAGLDHPPGERGEGHPRHLPGANVGEVGFRDRTGAGYLMARLRRFFNRAMPDHNEINILRGILTSVQGRRRRAGDPPVPRDTTTS